MSDLPDLNTSQISWIAYYNIVDQGDLSVDFDISEIASSSRVNSQTLYDNGIEGDYNPVTGDTIRFRGKQDGWIIAWMDQSGSDTSRTDSPPQGPWDIANQWSDSNTATGGFTQNTLERAISDLQSQLSVSDGITYNSADVGLFNYLQPNATTATLLSEEVLEGESGDPSTGLTYTDGTTISQHWVYGQVSIYVATTGTSGSGSTTFDGVTLADVSHLSGESGYFAEYSALDAEYRNIAQEAGTEYTGSISVGGGNSSQGGALHHLISWY